MNVQDALNTLGLIGKVSFEDISSAYRRMSMQYHPDRNPAGLHMMTLINDAYASLKGVKEKFAEDYASGFTNYDKTDNAGRYGEDVANAITAILNCVDLKIEVCGSWVWVGGDSKKYRDILRNAGFKYSSNKVKWYFRPKHWKRRAKRELNMSEIRDLFGSEEIETVSRTALR